MTCKSIHTYIACLALVLWLPLGNRSKKLAHYNMIKPHHLSRGASTATYLGAHPTPFTPILRQGGIELTRPSKEEKPAVQGQLRHSRLGCN